MYAQYMPDRGKDPSAELDLATEHCERARSSSRAFYDNLGAAQLVRGEYEAKTGSVAPSLDLALSTFHEALVLDPAEFEAHWKIGIALREKATLALKRGEDPSIDLREAEGAVRRMKELGPDDVTTDLVAGQLDVLNARWAIKNAKDPLPPFTRAEAAFRRGLARKGHEGKFLVPLADLLRQRADLGARGGNVAANRASGLAMIDAALLRDPATPGADVVRARIYLQIAKNTRNDDERRDAALHAEAALQQAALRDALAAPSLLGQDLDEARALACSVAPGAARGNAEAPAPAQP